MTEARTFRLPGDLADRVDAYVKQRDSDRSALIRDVLQEIAEGSFVPTSVTRERRVTVRVEDEILDRAARAVAAALGSERKLNEAVVQGLLARLDESR